MTHVLDVSRRSFLKASAVAAGGFTLGFAVPFGEASAQGALPPEVNAWVVVKPDDTVVVRIARSEMSQGTLTGLAQLVAEELEADWSKVTWEYPTPGQNVARNRVWKNFSTGGSCGIRESHQYVREGGAAARMMLVQAAANEWGVPAAECKAAKSVITHAASGRSTTYGKVAAAAAKLEPPKEVKLKDAKDWAIAGKPLTLWGSYFIGVAPNFTRLFYSRGLARNLNYLDFAYCQDLYDDGGTPLVQFPEV